MKTKRKKTRKATLQYIMTKLTLSSLSLPRISSSSSSVLHGARPYKMMGKSIPSASRIQGLARFLSSDTLPAPKQARPISRDRLPPREPATPGREGPSSTIPTKQKMMVQRQDGNDTANKRRSSEPEPLEGSSSRLPLAQVVSDCVRRWFQDTLKEAKGGDAAMQLLVGQMYNNGYGVTRDRQKGRAWINKASKARSSVWKVSDKQPGYNASDSDSDPMQDGAR